MTAVLLVIAVVLALNGVVLAIVSRRRPRAFRGHQPRVQTDATGITDVDRRLVLNRVMIGSLSVFALALGAGSLAFLWPDVKRGPGSQIVAGKRDRVIGDIEHEGRPVYNPEGKFYLVKYDGIEPEHYLREGALAGGLMALFQKCSHLGCRVPFCSSSGWFECPCHDAKFNAAGEHMSGPARGGMWHFPIEINERDEVVVDTSRRIAQMPTGTDTYRRGPAGPSCLSG